MKRTSNRKCGKLVDQLQEFRGSNLHSEWVGHHYVVFSYKWFPIFVWDDKKKRAYAVEDKYSRSTARQLSYVTREIAALVDKMPSSMFDRFKRPFKTV